MSHYVLRYFFDAGSGICLWSANDEAREKFDYPVQLSDLELPENLLRQAIHVMAWYDTNAVKLSHIHKSNRLVSPVSSWFDDLC